MRRLWKAAVVSAGVAMLAGPVVAMSPAGATPPTGYGFDNTSHVIAGGGSDTTFHVQLNLGDVFNLSQKAGCVLTTAVGPDLGKCIANALSDNLFCSLCGNTSVIIFCFKWKNNFII